jgi:hypothetical protein
LLTLPFQGAFPFNLQHQFQLTLPFNPLPFTLPLPFSPLPFMLSLPFSQLLFQFPQGIIMRHIRQWSSRFLRFMSLALWV